MARPPGYGSQLRKSRDKGPTDNHAAALPAKLQLRREALDAVGGAGLARVLDCFCGRGAMWEGAWRDAAAYLGCDRELSQVMGHPAPVHHAQAAVALRALDLDGFNVFDLDAYGSPWSELLVLCGRRRLRAAERVAVVLTDGTPRQAMLGSTSKAMAALAGIDRKAHGAHRRWPELVRAATTEAARRMGGELLALRQAAGTVNGRGMFYGLAVVGRE